MHRPLQINPRFARIDLRVMLTFDRKNEMGWLCRLLNATPKSELNGIRMDIVSPFWELQGETTFAVLLRALGDFLPAGSVLYFEGGSPDRKLLDFLNAHAIPEQTHVAVAILWPRPVYYHIPATPQNLAELAALAESHAEPELAVHFHAKTFFSCQLRCGRKPFRVSWHQD